MKKLVKFMNYVEDNYKKEVLYMDITAMLIQLALFVVAAQPHNLILVIVLFFLSLVQFNVWQADKIKKEQRSK